MQCLQHVGLRVDEAAIGSGRGHHGLLEEPVEQQPALPNVPPVEPEGELVEVGLQMPRVDRALVGAQQPALEQAGHPVHPGHGHVAGPGELDRTWR